MKSNDELKEVNIKSHTCYYFDEIIKMEDFDSDNILMDEKSYKNILVYEISKNELFGSKTLHIRFNEVEGFIRYYDGIRYSVLSGSRKHDAVYNRIRYLISQKNQSWFLWLFTSRKNVDFA